MFSLGFLGDTLVGNTVAFMTVLVVLPFRITWSHGSERERFEPPADEVVRVSRL